MKSGEIGYLIPNYKINTSFQMPANTQLTDFTFEPSKISSSCFWNVLSVGQI